jgi:hypothetical protein
VSDRPTFEVSYVLDDVVEILRTGRNNKKLLASRPLPATILEDFLFSGRFSSVLGLDGFRIFQDELHAAVVRLDERPIAPADLLEALLHSGVHYVDADRPRRLPAFGANPRRPTAYRHLARGFARFSWEDFAVLVGRFKETRGRATHVGPDDSPALRGLADGSDLFVVLDDNAALHSMGRSALRAICRDGGIAPARSIEATADRIVAHYGGDVCGWLPSVGNGHRSLVLREQDLATGDDVVRLAAYLRAVATPLCKDLCAFVAARRHAPWLRPMDAL